MGVKFENLLVGKRIGDIEGSGFSFKQLALVRSEFVHKPGSPNVQPAGVAVSKRTQLVAKASPGSLARYLWPAPGKTFGEIVATAHESNKNHSFSVKSGQFLGDRGVVQVHMRWAIVSVFRAPVSDRMPGAKHEGVYVFTPDHIDNPFALKESAFGFGLSRSTVSAKGKETTHLAGKVFWYGAGMVAHPFVTLELRFVRAIEYKDRVDR